MTPTRFRNPVQNLHRFWRSLATKLVCLVIVFAIVPWFIYDRLRVAYDDQEALLLNSIGEQGRLIAAGLQPSLVEFKPGSAPEISNKLIDLGSVGLRTRVLLRPTGEADPGSFYFVASWPPVLSAYLEQERSDLLRAGGCSRSSSRCRRTGP